ncbi:MAG: hypothetical protein LBS29_04275 [Endomicrobium sp.]|jgi:hypothetical protein|nr:hypothetical protein [Endomicrobium sp.]
MSEAMDITRSISQVVKLLEAQAIFPEDLGDYMLKLAPNLEFLDTRSEALTEDEIANLIGFVFENIPRDVIICDVRTEITDAITVRLLNDCDVIILVSLPNVRSLELVKRWVESGLLPKKPVMLLVNRYDTLIMPLSKAANIAGCRVRDTCKLRYNPFIIKNCNDGELHTIVPYVLDKDPRVVELNIDLKECVQFLFSHMNKKFKWGEVET